jgi:hypothetical protein
LLTVDKDWHQIQHLPGLNIDGRQTLPENNLALSNAPAAAQAFSCAAGTPPAPAEPCVVWWR